MKLNEEDLQNIGGFFKNLEDFCKINIKIIKKYRCLEGAMPLPIPIAAKPLEACGEAASKRYYIKITLPIKYSMEVIFLCKETFTVHSPF